MCLSCFVLRTGVGECLRCSWCCLIGGWRHSVGPPLYCLVLCRLICGSRMVVYSVRWLLYRLWPWAGNYCGWMGCDKGGDYCCLVYSSHYFLFPLWVMPCPCRSLPCCWFWWRHPGGRRLCFCSLGCYSRVRPCIHGSNNNPMDPRLIPMRRDQMVVVVL
jgi:hypothetical protein